MPRAKAKATTNKKATTRTRKKVGTPKKSEDFNAAGLSLRMIENHFQNFSQDLKEQLKEELLQELARERPESYTLSNQGTVHVPSVWLDKQDTDDGTETDNLYNAPMERNPQPDQKSVPGVSSVPVWKRISALRGDLVSHNIHRQESAHRILDKVMHISQEIGIDPVGPEPHKECQNESGTAGPVSLLRYMTDTRHRNAVHHAQLSSLMECIEANLSTIIDIIGVREEGGEDSNG